jgi:hypothetical protein
MIIQEFTLSSTDEDNYNTIITSLPTNDYDCDFMVTSLTMNGNFVVLNTSDYIEINNVRYYSTDNYSSLRRSEFIFILNEIIQASDIVSSLNNDETIKLSSPRGFTIDACSYNLRLLMGLPPFGGLNIISHGIYDIKTVGVLFSTPILYLTSSIGGSKTFMNDLKTNNLSNSSIVMRIPNLFSSNFPINSSNGEFSTRVQKNNIGDIKLTLVDGNIQPIKILSPIYITLTIKMEIKREESDFDNNFDVNLEDINTPKIPESIFMGLEANRFKGELDE